MLVNEKRMSEVILDDGLINDYEFSSGIYNAGLFEDYESYLTSREMIFDAK